MARKSKKSKSRPEDDELAAGFHAEDAAAEPPQEAGPAPEPPGADEPATLNQDGFTPEETPPVFEEQAGLEESPAASPIEEHPPENGTSVMPPPEPAAVSGKQPPARAGTVFLLFLVAGLGGLLFYQNRLTSRSTDQLKADIAALEARIAATEKGKMDEKSGVMIAQAVKSLREEVTGLKDSPPAPPEAAQQVPVEEAQMEEPLAAGEVPESEIAVDPHLMQETPESAEPPAAEDTETAGVEHPAGAEEAEHPAEETAAAEPGAEPEAAGEVAAADEEHPAGAEEAEHPAEETAAAEPDAEPEDAGEVAAAEEEHPAGAEEAEHPGEETAAAEPEAEPEAAGEIAAAEEEHPAGAEETAAEETDEEEVAARTPQAEKPEAHKAKVERAPVVRDYLSFIEDSARRFADLIKRSLDKTRGSFSSPQG